MYVNFARPYMASSRAAANGTKHLVHKLGFIQRDVDQAIFFKRMAHEKLIVVMVHVDNCTIASSTYELLVDLKVRMREYVEITDLGDLHWFL